MRLSVFTFISSFLHISAFIKHKIIRTAIFGFLPELKMHHIVVIESASIQKDAYAVDFSPLRQHTTTTMLQLALAVNIPGEVRIRRIHNGAAMNEVEFVETWYAMNRVDPEVSIQITNHTRSGICDKGVKKLVDEISTWDSNMNMYTHNCQHFSGFVERILVRG